MSLPNRHPRGSLYLGPRQSESNITLPSGHDWYGSDEDDTALSGLEVVNPWEDRTEVSHQQNVIYDPSTVSGTSRTYEAVQIYPTTSFSPLSEEHPYVFVPPYARHSPFSLVNVTEVAEGCVQMYQRVVSLLNERDPSTTRRSKIRDELGRLMLWIDATSTMSGSRRSLDEAFARDPEAQGFVIDCLEQIREQLVQIEGAYTRYRVLHHSLAELQAAVLNISRHINRLQQIRETQSTNSRARSTMDPLTSSSTSVSLTPMVLAFVSIPLEDYDGCTRFVRNNPDILESDTKVMLLAAISAIVRNDLELAQRIADRTVMINKSEISASFVRNLSKRNGMKMDHREQVQTLYNQLVKQAEYQERTVGHAIRRRPSQTSSSVADRLTQIDLYDLDSDEMLTTRSESRSRAISLTPQKREADASPPSSQTGSANKSSTSYSRSSKRPSTTSLMSSFKVQARPNNFFVFGKIFKVLWHEPVGADLAGRASASVPHTSGAFSEPIYSSLRWMMVVIPKRNCSICCPITTYSGQGLTSKNLHLAEINAHAIVYAEGSRPYTLPGEKSMKKPPIQINMLHNVEEEVHRASRINFGKLYTVEWNVKVKEIGSIGPEWKDKVLGYLAEELGLSGI